jgi:hypothetical protein
MSDSIVCYLCPSPDRPGVVFPRELPKGSYLPGVFAFPSNGDSDLPDTLQFWAVRSGEETLLKAVRADVNGVPTYLVDADDAGRFFFAPLRWEERYIGRSSTLSDRNRLWLLEPLSPGQLEETCHGYGLFFIGFTDVEEGQEQRPQRQTGPASSFARSGRRIQL